MIKDKDKFEIAFLLKKKGANKSQIARDYGVSRGSVTTFGKMFDSDYKDNAHIRHQMLLGSKLGDGYFQETANGIYKYRETHSVKEVEYAMWKYLMLGEHSDGVEICNKNNGNAVELYTNARASSFVEHYYNLTTEDTIKNIEIEGLLVWLLDDGWYSDHSSKGDFNICSTILTSEQKGGLQAKFSQYGIGTSLIGKRQDISISSQDNYVLLAHLEKMMFTLDLDIVNKKFGNIIKQLTAIV